MLPRATLNHYMNALVFSSLSTVSVDGKQHLSEVVFGALVDFYYKDIHSRHAGLRLHEHHNRGDEFWV
jgi:hypothetical protein